MRNDKKLITLAGLLAMAVALIVILSMVSSPSDTGVSPPPDRPNATP